MRIIYNIGILLFTALIRFVSPFNHKARLWINGRKGWAETLRQKLQPGTGYIWIHCASLGEFEQGRPLIEAIKKHWPGARILLTFFSPSGYEIRKDYSLADVITYLPSDSPFNAKRFTRLVNPVMALFVKYEFWYNYINELKRRNIPVYLVSAIFRKDQHFFKWYGRFFYKILQMFSMIYVQDLFSYRLLKEHGIEHTEVAGDTRFDRVSRIAENAEEIQVISEFRGDEKLFIAGSSWKQDEEIIAAYLDRYPGKMKWVFAPHETDEENIKRLEKLLTVSHVRFSRFESRLAGARVLIIDNMGMLSSAYRYAYIAAVGGGFGKGIHNILEAACWNIPVLFGPGYKKFREAIEMIDLHAAASFSDYDEFEAIMDMWISDEKQYNLAAGSAGKYVKENTGATYKIIEGIGSDRINTQY